MKREDKGRNPIALSHFHDVLIIPPKHMGHLIQLILLVRGNRVSKYSR